MTPEISPAAEATARLGAALHGAHRLLPLTTAHEILEHWCDRALEADPGVARAMVHLTTMRLALLDGAPAVLTEAFRRLQASTYRMTLQHGLRWGNLDGAVIRAITAALRVAGRPEAEEIGRLIENAAERLRLPVDLAAGERFLAAPLERLFPEVMDSADPTLHGRTTLRAHWPVTAFDLPLSRRSRRAPLRLELVARLPAVPGADRVRTGTARLTIEGHPLGHAVLGDAWTRAPFDLDPEALQPGLHRLAIHWPRLPPVGTQALEAARRTLQLGRQADLHPVFGEIESMRVLPPPREGRSLRSHHGRHGGTAASSRGPDADTGGREDVGDKPPAQTCGAQVPISSPLPRTRR